MYVNCKRFFSNQKLQRRFAQKVYLAPKTTLFAESWRSTPMHPKVVVNIGRFIAFNWCTYI